MKGYLFLDRINLTTNFCRLLKRHGQCTWKTILHDIIISLQFRKKICFQSYNRGYRKSGKS